MIAIGYPVERHPGWRRCIGGLSIFLYYDGWMRIALVVLQSLPFYAEASNASGSCFNGESFTSALRRWSALSSPQAFCLSEELPASLAKLIAAFRSRSSTWPQSSQRNVRSASVRSSSTEPLHEQVFDGGSHRLAISTRQPYHVA